MKMMTKGRILKGSMLMTTYKEETREGKGEEGKM